MTSTPVNERRLRVALVGCGAHAHRSILPCLPYLRADLVATCDADADRARACATQHGAGTSFGSLAELIESELADAVLLAVGPQLHPALACEAMTGRLHVWMEKPPGMAVADIDRMMAARATTGRHVAVGFKKAFMPAMDRMLHFARSDKFGRIRSIAGRFPMDVPADGPAVLAERRGTNWLGNGVHPLSALVCLAGRPQAMTVLRSARGGGFVTFEFSDGVVGCLHLAMGHAMSAPMERYEVVCEHGHLVLENNTRLCVYRPGYPFDYRHGDDFACGDEEVAALIYEPQHTLSTLENKAIFLQGFVQELRHFVDSCLENRPPTRGTLEFARVVMECYEAGLQSGGKTVVLDELACNQGSKAP